MKEFTCARTLLGERMVQEETCKIATVGCGAIADFHLKTLGRTSGLKVVAVCDRDEKRAIAASTKFNIPRHYIDFSKMLDKEDISIVSILTPPSSHVMLAIEAIKRGINVLVEKPLAESTREADSIMSALKKSDTKLTLDYSWLFCKAMLQSLSLIRKREIGDILQVEIKYLHTGKDHMTSDPKHWCHKLLGGRFGENLPHPVYTLQSILGDNLQVKDIFASKRGEYPWMLHDELFVTLQGEKTLGSIYISFNAIRNAILIDVYGTKRILKIDLTNQTIIGLGYRSCGKRDIARDSIWLSCKSALSSMRNAFEFPLRRTGEKSLQNIYIMFVDSIKKNADPPVTPKMAYNTVRIVEEICQRL